MVAGECAYSISYTEIWYLHNKRRKVITQAQNSAVSRAMKLGPALLIMGPKPGAEPRGTSPRSGKGSEKVGNGHCGG